MANIEDLRKSISEMSDSELMDEIRNIRLSRRTPKTKTGTKKTSTKKVVIDINSMTPQQAQDFLKELEEEGLDDT